MIDDILSRLSGKCRWYDIIETSGTSIPISFKNNRLYDIQEKENNGFGVRVNIEGKTGFSYTNDEDRLDAAVERALSLTPYGDHEDFELPSDTETGFEPYSEKILDFSIDDEISRADEAVNIILKKYPDVSIDMSIGASQGHMRLINSNGLDLNYKNSIYTVSLSLTQVLDDGTRIDVWEGASFLDSCEYKHIIDRIIEKTGNAMKNCSCPSGRVPVLLTPKAGSRLLGIISSGLNARSVWKGISPFADKKDHVMFNEKFSLLDDPALEGSPYSYPFDDEGITGEKKFLIEGGRIKDFITDLKHAQRLNIRPMGNSSRGYSSLPMPSFSNVIIQKGDGPLKSIMLSEERIILVDQFIGLGQSNTLTGDFSAGLDLAYLVEKGEVTGRLKDCMISDNLFKLMAGEVYMSSETEQRGSMLLPYIMFPQVNFTS